jgi:1-acyl-sn-glycerol-3-phosphate acyltransferase
MSERMYTFTRFAIRMIVRVLFGVRITGPAHAAVKGPMLVCSNHISSWDPPVIGCFMGRLVTFMAKEELFQFRPLGMLLHWVHAFPIKRGSGDRGALRLALEILGRGGTLVMFPEGTRKTGGNVTHIERGVGFLALKSRAAVQPVIIRGQYKLFGRTRIHYGKPFFVHDELAASIHLVGDSADGAHEKSTRSDVDAARDIIQQKMLELLKETERVAKRA